MEYMIKYKRRCRQLFDYTLDGFWTYSVYEDGKVIGHAEKIGDDYVFRPLPEVGGSAALGCNVDDAIELWDLRRSMENENGVFA